MNKTRKRLLSAGMALFLAIQPCLLTAAQTEEQTVIETGRTIPISLNEQMAMHQVQSNPLEGAMKVPIKMTDPRWPASEG